MNKEKFINLSLWFWVSGVAFAYVYQFRGVARQILNLVGLS